MIFFGINHNKQIIVDTGGIKCQLFLFGELLYFLSLNFNRFLNYNNCALNFFLKHSGILLFYIISLLYVSSGLYFGLDFKKLERLNLAMFQSKTKSFVSTTSSKEILVNIEKELNNLGNLNNEIDSSNSNLKSSSTFDENEEKIKLNKSLAFVHSFYIELSFVYIFSVIIISIIAFFSSIHEEMNRTFITEYNGKWRYLCPLEQYDLLIDIIELLMVFCMIIVVLKIWNYTYIFKCIKYMRYSAIVWITLGPLANVINQYIIEI